MEALETVVIWVLLIVAAGLIGLIVRVALKKIQSSLTQSTAAPGLIGTGVGFGLAAALLPSEDVPFLIGLIVAIGGGLLAGYAAKRLVGENDAIGLALAVVASIAAIVLAAAAGSPGKLVGYCAVLLVGVFTLALMGSRALPAEASRFLPWVGAGITFLGLFDWLQAKVGSDLIRMERILVSPEMERIAATIWAVILAVGGSTALFIGANLVFNRTDKHWRQFSAIAGGTIGFVVFGLLDGNRIIQFLGPRDTIAENFHDAVNNGFWTLLISSVVIGALLGYAGGYAVGVSRDDRSKPPLVGAGVGAVLGLIWGTLFAQRIPVDTTVLVLWNALTGAILGASFGYITSSFEDVRQRTVIAVAAGAGIGLLVGGMLFITFQPRLETVPLIVAPVVFAAAGAGLNRLRGRNVVTGLATGGLIGWLIGAFGIPQLGGGPEIETLVATGVAGALSGLRYGAKPTLNSVERVNLEQRSRAAIFLFPALGFIATGLVIPLIRTAYLSFFDERSEFWVGLQNYKAIFTDDRSFDLGSWRDLFTSQLFRIGAILMIAALILGMIRGRTGGNNLRGSRFIVPALGALMVFAAFREIRVATGDDGSFSLPTVVYLVLLVAGAGLLLLSGAFAFGDGAPTAHALTPGRGAATAGRQPLSASLTNLAGGQGAIFAVGAFFLMFAAFASLRGTIFNNLWWVFTVTLLAAGFGLAVAVLADRASYENLAKSLIFMPLRSRSSERASSGGSSTSLATPARIKPG